MYVKIMYKKGIHQMNKSIHPNTMK